MAVVGGHFYDIQKGGGPGLIERIKVLTGGKKEAGENMFYLCEYGVKQIVLLGKSSVEPAVTVAVASRPV